jgi:hypothetical protein
MNRSGMIAAGLSADSPWDTCSDATRDTAATLCRLVFSYQRSALHRSLVLRFVFFQKPESALRKTIVSSSA